MDVPYCFLNMFRFFNTANIGSVAQRTTKLPSVKVVEWFDPTGSRTRAKRTCTHFCTLTDMDSSCPKSILKTTPPPQGYPWVFGGQYVTPEPRFSGLVLNHQGLEELELKITQNCCFWSDFALFESFFSSGSFESWLLSIKHLNLGSGVTYQPLDTHGYPGAVE